MASIDGDARLLARVERISDDGETLFLSLLNGAILTADISPDDELGVDDIVLVDAKDGDLTAVDSALWPDQSRIGTVRIKNTDKTAVSMGGVPALIPTNEGVSYTVGDTVRFTEKDGVLSTLTREHVNWIERPHDATTRAGTVMLKNESRTTLSVSGVPTVLPTTDTVSYNIGDTVEFSETAGILSLLSTEAVKWIDRDREDDSVEISRFRIQTDDHQLSFNDFGGSADIIARAKDLIEIPLRYRQELARIGAPSVRGVLFYGPPGTGKTHLARIIATQAGAAFYLINGPEIFSKYVGDSEAVLRKIFDDAKLNQPAIIFFDEIDSVAAERKGDSHDSSRRAVAQLLTLMDGFEPDRNVMVIAATNRRKDIDKALLRPGRFDVQLEFRHPNLVDRAKVLRASGKKIRIADGLPFERVAELTDGWSAAELAAIWTEASLLAVKAGHDSVLAEDLLEGFESRGYFYHTRPQDADHTYESDQ